MTNFIQSILYGLTTGGILYIISVGLSLTFGAMGIVNFAHGIIYVVGAYALYTVLTYLGAGFVTGILAGIAVSIPISYLIERLIIRKLYGQSIDYAIIATFACLLIGADALRWIYGATPVPVSDPIGLIFRFAELKLPVYRVVVIGISILSYFALSLFLKKTLVGKIVIAGLQDSEALSSLGIKPEKYFAIVFIIGSALAALGGGLHAPLSSLSPYSGFHIIVMCFAVVIVGGMGGNIKGTAVAAFSLGMVHALTASYIYAQGANAMIFVVMAAVIAVRSFRSIET